MNFASFIPKHGRRSSRKIVVVLMLMPMLAQAAIQDVRVLAAGVDRSASKAETLAIDYAKKRAVYLVARKLPIEDASGKVAALTAKDFSKIVRGATVLQTKRTGNITYADVTVSVVDSALRAALGVKDRENSEAERNVFVRSVLVLPVFVKDDRAFVWEKENALRAPLQEELLRQAQGRILTPAGDLDDLRLVDYQNVLTVDQAGLAAMLKRYHTDEIMIPIYAAPEVDAKEPPVILLRRVSASGVRSERIAMPEEQAKAASVSEKLAIAARLIAGAAVQIATSSAEDERAKLAKATKVPLMFNYANSRELARMQEAVRAAPGVLLLEMPSISLRGGLAGIAYLDGEAKKLRESLDKAGIIVREKDSSLQLSYR